MSSIRAKVRGYREPNRWGRRGYIFCWYYEVIDTETGNVLASDNTGNWRLILNSALRDIDAIRHCKKLGILKKARSW